MRHVRSALSFGPLVLTLCLLACASSPGQPGDGGLTLLLTAPSDTLTFLGQERQLTAVVHDVEGDALTAPSITWLSRAPGVLQVDDSGTVTAVDNGDAVIVARAGEAADSLTLTVAQEPVALSVSGVDTLFTLGVRTRLQASAEDAGGQPYTLAPLSFTSSDTAVATVDGDGLLLPRAAGSVDVTVSAGDLTQVHTVSVEDVVTLEIDPGLAESLQWALEDVSSGSAVIGAQAAVVIPGVGVWVGAFGRSGEVSVMRPGMAVPVGSVAKTVISGLVLHLVDQGMLDLDDPLSALLPPFDNVTPTATLRQVLQNNSGIASFTSAPGFLDSLIADLNRVWTPEELLGFVGPAEFAPGASWKSSNTGYLLGAMIAEAVTGQQLADLYANELYTPLDLEQIFLKGSQPARAPLAETWNGPAGGPFENFSTTYDGPSFQSGRWPLGPLVVNARTLAAWGEALFTDFLSPAVRAEMLTAIPDDGGIPNQVGAGVGVRKFNFLGRTQWGHSGTASDGSGMLLFDEASGITVALVYNQNGPSHSASHFTLAPQLLQLALSGQ